MPDVNFSFDDRLHEDGKYVLGTRQIVFGVNFGDDDNKPGDVYEFVATDETADAFRKVMERFMKFSRKVDKVALPKVPNNGGRMETLRRQRRQVADDMVPKALTGAKPVPAVVIPAEDVPDGFWQTPKGLSNNSTEGTAYAKLRTDIKAWAIAQGLAEAGDFGRGRIPGSIGIAYGQAHPDRIPKGS